MLRIILSVCAIIIFNVYSYAQILIVKADLGSCPKCQIPLSLLRPSTNEIPTYILLPEDLKDASNEIEQMYGLRKMGFVTLYDDEIASKFVASSVPYLYLLDATGNILWKKPLLEITGDEIIKGNKLYAEAHVFRNSETQINKILYNKLYSFDYVLHRLKVHMIGDTLTYKMTDSDKLLAMKKSGLKQAKLSSEAQAFFSINKQFNPSFIGYYPFTSEEVFLMGRYYLASAVDTNTVIAPKNAIFHYKGIRLVKVSPISDVNLIPGYAMDPANFIIVDTQTLLLQFTISQQIPLKRPAKFIGLFRLINGSYVFDRQLDIELPSVYKSNFGYNLISFSASSYPFLAMPFGLEIYNLKNQKTIRVTFPKEVDYSEVNINTLIEVGDKDVPYKNLSLDYDESTNTIYLINYYLNNHYLQLINPESGEVKAVIQLNGLIPGLSKSKYIAVNAKSKVLYVEGKSKMVYGYPLFILK